MKLAHLADLHLGFRQYYRNTPAGINQREADVAAAFECAVTDVIAARPDAVLIAGDLFHTVRPTNFSIVFAFRQLSRLRTAMPEAPIIIAAGNHDTPRSSETGSILALFEELGIHLATDQARRFAFPQLDLSVFAVPEATLRPGLRPALNPEGPEKYHVLLLHGEIDGVIAGTHPSDQTLAPEELGAGWNYGALGHYHVQHEVAPGVWYSGATDYTSSNIWGELADEAAKGIEGKGWLLADLAAGTVERRLIPPVRLVCDLERIEGMGLAAAELDVQLAERIASLDGQLEGAILRLRVDNVDRAVSRGMDHGAIRGYKARALQFQLEFVAPDQGQRVADRAALRRLSLADLFALKLGDHDLPAAVSRERFVAAGHALFNEVDDECR